MESLFLALLIIFLVIAIFFVWAWFNFINIFRKRGFEKMDSEHNTVVFLLLHPDYNIRSFFLALNKTEDKYVEKARMLYLISIIVALAYLIPLMLILG